VDCAIVMTELEKRGTPEARKAWSKQGVKGKSFGVGEAALAALAKKIGRDQNLATELWKTANHDARMLATLVANPVYMNAATVDRWARDADNHLLTGAVSEIAAQAAAIGAGVKVADAKRWSDSPDEWIGSLGWTMLGLICGAGKLPERDAQAALDRIERGILTAKNRTRHAMNGALIEIGNGIPALRERALAMAQRLGKIEVDHGESGGETPDAHAAILRGKSGKAAKKPGAVKASPGKKPASNGSKPASATVPKKKAAAAGR